MQGTSQPDSLNLEREREREGEGGRLLRTGSMPVTRHEISQTPVVNKRH